MDNRRQFERANSDLWVEENAIDGTYYHLAKDIGPGGLYLSKTFTFPRGTSMNLSIPLPNQAPIKATAEVVYVREAGSGSWDCKPKGMGLRFTSLEEEDAETLRAFVRSSFN